MAKFEKEEAAKVAVQVPGYGAVVFHTEWLWEVKMDWRSQKKLNEETPKGINTILNNFNFNSMQNWKLPQ
jgi:hypothetical protein